MYYLPEDLITLWKELSKNPRRLSPDQLRREMEWLRTGLRRRSMVGYCAAFIVIAGFTALVFRFPNVLQRIGSILTVLGAGYLVLQLRMRRAQIIPVTDEIDRVRFYRTELERQRDTHRGAWFWSRLMIFLAGPLIWLIGFAQARPKHVLFIWVEFAAVLMLAAIAVPLNLRLARRYQCRIDALDASLNSTE